ncbi:MAG: [protein-PII] uridylyltransferase [Gammaproteobacteria bacterium]|nr:MAG: [protein-PII] uridylyltransferase [Gammaproteobacteria bacterium]
MFDFAHILDDLESSDKHPVKAYRDVLARANEQLKQAFFDNQSVNALVKARSDLIDSILDHAWRRIVIEESGQTACSLVAVGGYGRGELHPHSDIDLLILLPRKKKHYSASSIEQFHTFLWDIGLDVGQSARTVKDCVYEARHDITIATNLMEARLIAGPKDIYDEMRKATGPKRLWKSRDFCKYKLKEQQNRHHKFYDTTYNLEPNIKEGPGGLRDIQMVGWVVKRHFDVDNLHELVEHEFLTENEFKSLIDGQEFLWKIRMALHYLTGRREDRLLFDHQHTLAKQFLFTGKNNELAVEQFMKLYYRTVVELNRLNEMLLQLFQEVILLADRKHAISPINPRFQSRNGYIEVTSSDVISNNPFTLLEIFLILEQRSELRGVRAETIRLIRDALPLINDEFRRDAYCRQLFIDILRQPQGITHELRRMNRYGVLAAYLPEFNAIVGQMQYDLFHVYTVDEHTLFVVRNLRRFMVPEFYDEFPQCSNIMCSLDKPEILYIAGLYHDIAKGRGGDHSTLGADDAMNFCLRHSMNQYEAKMVSWLVKNHLLMSMTAQRKDISDPEVINHFAEQIGDKQHLDLLYLLTVADIRGTNPELWTTWKAALLWSLFTSTRQAFRRGLNKPIDQSERISRTLSDTRTLLHEQDIDEDKVNGVWSNLTDDYFLRYSPQDICRHTLAIIEFGASSGPLVFIYEPEDTGGTAIFIYTTIREDLFATITATLDQLGLSIVDARIIHSRDDMTLDTYLVLDERGKTIRDENNLSVIINALNKQINSPDITADSVSRRLPRQHKHFQTDTEVIFTEDKNNNRTIMEVIASDQPGLLAKTGKILQQHDIHIQNAKITTMGNRVEDIFYITDEHHSMLDDSTQSVLRAEIIEAL